MIVNALAKNTGRSSSEIAHRLIGTWDPLKISFEELLSAENMTADLSKPYPFFLAYPIEGEVDALGEIQEWQAEWKWDGIRGQVIKRDDAFFVWSRGEELLTAKFPEFASLHALLPLSLIHI